MSALLGIINETNANVGVIDIKKDRLEKEKSEAKNPKISLDLTSLIFIEIIIKGSTGIK